jgi:hypothetical protein
MGWVNKESNIKKHQDGAKLEASSGENILSMLKSALSGAGEVVGDVASSAVEKVGEGYEMATDVLSETGEKIGEKAVNFIDDNYETQNERALRLKKEFEDRKLSNERQEHNDRQYDFSSEYSYIVDRSSNNPGDFKEIPLNHNEFMNLSDIDKRKMLDNYNIPLTNDQKLKIAMDNRDYEVDGINQRIEDLKLERQYVNNEVTGDSLMYEWMNIYDNIDSHIDNFDNRLSNENIEYDKYMLTAAKKYFQDQGISIEGPQGPPEAQPLLKQDSELGS